MGNRQIDGSSRAKLVKESEKLRASVLDKALLERQGPHERAATVRKNADKLSTAFLLSKPGPHSGIPGSFFSEQILALMAVPSVLCRGKVGERVGRLIVGRCSAQCHPSRKPFYQGRQYDEERSKQPFQVLRNPVSS